MPVATVDTISLKFDSPGIRERDNMMVVTIGADAHYKILYWLGIGAGIGYRKIISNDRAFTFPKYKIALEREHNLLIEAL